MNDQKNISTANRTDEACKDTKTDKKPNIVRRLYNWVLSWADSKWGAVALFCIAFAESSFFPVPPDVLLIALCLGCVRRSFRYALICSVASVMGAMAGYAIGYFLWFAPSGEFSGIAQFFFDHVFTQNMYEAVRQQYEQYNFWIIFTAGFTPLPFKLFTVTGGVFHIDFLFFVLASVVSRSMRFFLVAGLIWKFGAPIKSFIDKYFNLLAIAFTVLLIGGFIAIKYLI